MLEKLRPIPIHPYALVCGDPARAEKIAQKFDEHQLVLDYRGYLVFNGTASGAPITVAAHGVGAAGAAGVFESLIRCGVKTLIRVGTAGSLREDIVDGDLVIATAAVREEGVTPQLVPLSYPAVADIDVVKALQQAAKARKVKHAVGIVQTRGPFFPGVLPFQNQLMSQAGAVATEMECAALFIIASLHRARAGAILAIDGMAIGRSDPEAYNPHRPVVWEAVDREIDIAIEAICTLAKQDKA
ncbi:MAG: nucleoside phosphorylase [Chloroflexi bacterium]|nr:nucleoside phosphorylase [Chloroflexota bacterium]MCL5075200.1 nucleoside phosphorylase [Chloroflexota bacterium]